MKLKITLFVIFCTVQINAQKWSSTLPPNPEQIFKSAVVYGYLGDYIYVSGNDGVQYYNNFIFSSDKGQTWSAPTPIFTDASNKEQIVQFLGVKDRLYAVVSTNQGYKYYYSMDHGGTWVLDSGGLPGKWTSSTSPEYKGAFALVKLSEDYIVAYNTLDLHDAYYKKIGDPTWRPMVTYQGGKAHTAFTSIGNTWYALNQGYVTTPDEKITVSSDFGQTWQQISKTGLPADFEGGFLTSNNQDKLFYGAGSTDTNKTDVYVSDDGGVTWQLTNAGTLGDVNEELNYITNIYANDNDVVITYYFPGFENAPRYVYSDTQTVNFKQGDVSGIQLGGPFTGKCFFDINGQFYAIFRHILYSSNTGTLKIEKFNMSNMVKLYPNPASRAINIESKASFSWGLYSMHGEMVLSGHYSSTLLNTSTIQLKSLESGVYILKNSKGLAKRVVVL